MNINLADVDEVYYSDTMHDYLIDTAHGTQLIHEVTDARIFAQITAYVSGWTQEALPEGVRYIKPDIVVKHRNAGGHIRRAG